MTFVCVLVLYIKQTRVTMQKLKLCVIHVIFKCTYLLTTGMFFLAEGVSMWMKGVTMTSTRALLMTVAQVSFIAFQVNILEGL